VFYQLFNVMATIYGFQGSQNVEFGRNTYVIVIDSRVRETAHFQGIYKIVFKKSIFGFFW